MDALSEAILRLLRRQERIERQLARLEAALNLQPIAAETAAPSASQPPLTPEPLTPAPLTPAQLPTPAPVPTSGPPPRRLETNLGLTLVNRIGVVTLVLGIAFFFKWAVDNQWIGPTGRVILGLISGLGGHRRRGSALAQRPANFRPGRHCDWARNLVSSRVRGVRVLSANPARSCIRVHGRDYLASGGARFTLRSRPRWPYWVWSAVISRPSS